MNKRHVITSGEYSDYRIIDVLEGAENPSIEDLYRQFRDIYIPGSAEIIQSNKGRLAFSVLYDLELEGVKKAVADGLIEHSIDGLDIAFVNWLIAKHDYRRLDIGEFQIDWREKV